MKWKVGTIVIVGAIGLTVAATSRPIPRDARIYIEAMPNDFDVYLKAEIIKKGVQVIVVSTPEAADYLLSGTAQGREKTDWHEGWLTTPKDKYTGAVEVVNARGELVWAAEAGDRSLWFPGLKRGGARKAAGRIASQMKKAVGSTSFQSSRSQDWWRPADSANRPDVPLQNTPPQAPLIQEVGPSKASLSQCLSFDNLRTTVLDDAGAYWTVDWKVNVVNQCAESVRIEVVFTSYDSDKNRLEEADKLVLVGGNGVTLVESRMAIEAAKGKEMALEGVGLRTAP